LQIVSQLSGEFPDVSFEVGTANALVKQPGRQPALMFWLGESSRPESFDFHSLPILSRLDASSPAGDRINFVRDALHAALGR
jgi:hypothetical protein